MIASEALRTACLSPRMEYYFHRKLAPLPPAEINPRIEEALKFLYLAVHSPGPIPISQEIDDVWHYWILETAEYEALCRKLPGGCYLHHSSDEYAEFADRDAKGQPIDTTIQMSYLGAYVKNYGPFCQDRVHYWPFAKRLMDLLGWSLDELNARLQGCAEAAEPVMRQPEP